LRRGIPLSEVVLSDLRELSIQFDVPLRLQA
jgi:hypothetical protein